MNGAHKATGTDVGGETSGSDDVDEMGATQTHERKSGRPPAGDAGPELLGVAPGTILDRVFRVEREIGRGGMGAVYEVEHTALGKRFAAKVLSRRAGKTGLERLRHEARVTGGLQHENIVSVTHLGETPDGEPFVVMELLRGQSLGDWLQELRHGHEAPVAPDREVRVILEQVLSGMSAAHKQRIVHRDLKPDNIFLVQRGDYPQAKIVDFGIARVLAESDAPRLTQEGQIIGTPMYMAPEQATDMGKVDARSDVYSIGCIAFELLTGRAPFEGNSSMAVLVAHATQDPPSLAARRPDLSPAVAQVIMRALAKDPDERYAHAGKMLSAWQRAWGGPMSVRSVAPPPPESDRPPVSEAALRAGAVPALATTVRSEDSDEVFHATPAEPRPRAAVALVIGAIGALLGLGALAWVALSPAPSSPNEPAAAATTAPHPPNQPTRPEPQPGPVEQRDQPEEPTEATLLLHAIASRPAGAAVFRDGEPLGETPLVVELPEGQRAHLVLKAPHYRDYELTIGGDSREEVEVRLRRVRATPRQTGDIAPL